MSDNDQVVDAINKLGVLLKRAHDILESIDEDTDSNISVYDKYVKHKNEINTLVKDINDLGVEAEITSKEDISTRQDELASFSAEFLERVNSILKR